MTKRRNSTNLRIGLVLGEQPSPDGKINEEFKARLDTCAESYYTGVIDLIVVSGAATIPSFPSEAEMARQYLDRKGGIPLDCIVTEEKARTTGQNIGYTLRILLERRVSRVRIFGRASQQLKTEVYVRRLWPKDIMVTFIPCRDDKSLIFQIVDQTVMALLASFDPTEERITKPLQKLFRKYFVPTHH